MEKRRKIPLHRDYCPLLKAAAILGDKWGLMIIREAFFGFKRFDDFKENLQISKSVLSTKLKMLLEHEVLQKVPYQTEKQRQRYEYILTAKGEDLYKILIGLIEWGNDYLIDEGHQKVAILSAHNKAPLKTHLQDKDGNEHHLKDVRLALIKKEPIE
jgi:DNA-binding HxlR family transcriptional regulator